MDTNADLADILRSVAAKGLQLLTNFKQHPIQLPIVTEKYRSLTHDFQLLSLALLKNPIELQQIIATYWQDSMELFQEEFELMLEGKIKPINDKRFSSEAWTNNPFFNLLSQQYLLASEHFQSLLERIECGDKKIARRVQFFMRQYLDALSPDNFVQTNPQLMAETLQTQGKNLLVGLDNLLTDLDSDSYHLNIKMTDMSAFKIGKNIAITPGHVIFRNELIELIQYTPQTKKVRSTPLLIIPTWINKYYILDLSPHNSLIRWLVTQGITVFVISWVNPGARHAKKRLYDYLNEGPMKAITMIQKQLKVKQVNTIGFCIGGTLLAILLAYYKAHSENPIRSATFLASLIDFSDPGDIQVFIDENQIKTLEARMNAKGYLEGRLMSSIFNSLRASDLIWSFFIKNYLSGKAPVPFDLLYWNADSTNMPAKMHSQYLRMMYLHNNLIKPGKIKLNHTPIDVNLIDIPTFFISTEKDHIAPWKTTYLGYQLMQGEKRFLLGGSGHIAGIVIPPGTEKYGFYQNLNHPKQPKAWLDTAVYSSGSWWPEWLKWLYKKSGRLIDAPSFATLPFQSISDAPGSYVHQVANQVD